MEDYVVLRIEGVPERPGGGGMESNLGGSTLDFGAAPEEARIEISTVQSEAQAAKAADDPRNFVAKDFPVMQIVPYDSEGAPAAPAADGAASSWGIAAVGADAAPANAAEGVVVAVLDTGLTKDHPCFDGMDIKRKNFVLNSSEYDTRGHGTHCASTIFGRDVDGKRVGIARGMKKALIGKVFDDDGRTSTNSVITALQWAHGEGANIVSMSLGFDFVALRDGLRRNGLTEGAATSRALKQYREVLRQFDALTNFLRLEAANMPGILLVAAAGNESRRGAEPPYEIDVSMPAAADNVISVAALMQRDGTLYPASYSNTGATLAAPGSGILGAALTGGLVTKDGTSMACPHVAGVAALWWARMVDEDGYASAKVVSERMLGNVRRLAALTNAERGRGLVRAPGPAVVG